MCYTINGDSMRSKKKRKLKISKILIMLSCLIILIIGVYLLLKGTDKVINNPNNKDKDLKSIYISSETASVALYNTSYEEIDTIFRGTEVLLMDPNVVDGANTYSKIKYNNKIYLILNAYTTSDMNEIIKETSMYVRTPATVYDGEDSLKILGLAKKGEALEILGYDYLIDGVVNKYHIKYGDIEGYVYAKYLLPTYEEAIKYYEEDGSNYQYHLKMGDSLGGGSAETLDYYPFEKGNFKDNVMPSEVRALYINAGAIRNVDEYIEFAKNNNINAFVVDIKDNTMPAYESLVMLEYSKTNYDHAYSTLEAYKGYIKKIKDAGFYVIGRITTFKDSFFVQDHPEVAIMNSGTNSPFNHNGSYWPSAYQRKVWEFNVSLAVEAVKEMGFNEIQFDYVRFPDRTYKLEQSNSINMNNTYGESKAQAIQAFTMYAADALHEAGAYISVDVFGESAHDYVTAYGQYWPAISNVVDVISGMPYPDHFDAHTYGIEEVVWTVPYKLLKAWGNLVAKKQSVIPTPAIVRTWIQTYNTSKSPSVVYDASKVSDQIRGLYENGLTGGYMTWNSGSSLTKYREIAEAFKKEHING